MDGPVEYQTTPNVSEEKTARLSLHLLVKRHLPPEAEKWDHEQIVIALNKITHLRLDREKIKEIDNLELLGDSVTNVYLQSNCIECIENLECLKNITFLTLSNNRIKLVQNLSHLKKLLFLDLSENRIASLDASEIPQTVIILNLLKNPCTSEETYRQDVIQALPRLQQLDLCDVTNKEKRDVGLDVSSDEEEEEDNDDEEEEEKMKDFKGKIMSKATITPVEDFMGISTEMLMRSQNRLETDLQVHRIHDNELKDLRVSWNVPDSARSMKSSRVFKKKKSSKR